MATITLEERLSAVEAELAELKQRIGMSGTQPTLISKIDLTSEPIASATVRKQTIGEKMAAIRAQDPEAWQNLPSDLAERHNSYINEAIQAEGKMPGALNAALEKIWREVPDEAWDALPDDFGANLDHYIYGTSKR